MRCPAMERSCPRKPAETLAFPVTYCAALAMRLDSLGYTGLNPSADGAVRKKHSWSQEKCMRGPFLRSVDENWGGSLKSRLLSGVTSPSFSRACRSSMSAALILC